MNNLTLKTVKFHSFVNCFIHSTSAWHCGSMMCGYMSNFNGQRKLSLCSSAIKREFQKTARSILHELCHFPSSPTCFLTRVSLWSSSHYSSGHMWVIFMCEITLEGGDEGHWLWIYAYHLIVEQWAAEGGRFPLGKTHPMAHCSSANVGLLYNENYPFLYWFLELQAYQGSFIGKAIEGQEFSVVTHQRNTIVTLFT